MAGSSTKKLFLSYSRDDIGIARALVSHLKPLTLSGGLQIFFDTESLEKGTHEWEATLQQEIASADGFIFLMSRSYFDSEYVINQELPRMIKRYRDGEEKIKFWPFYLSDYAWHDLAFDGFGLSSIQALGPFDDQERLVPLNKLNLAEQEKQFVRVYEEIKRWVSKVKIPPKPESKTESVPLEPDLSGYLQRLFTAKGIGELQRLEIELELLRVKYPENVEVVELEQRIGLAINKEKSRVSAPTAASAATPLKQNKFSLLPWIFGAVLLLMVIGIYLYLVSDEQPVVVVTPKVEKPIKQPDPQVNKQPKTHVFIEPKMTVIKGGAFMMGSPKSEFGRVAAEGPQHKAQIKTFELGIYEVTFAEYDHFVKATKRKNPDDENWGRGNRPVIYVSWKDATAYASWLSEQAGNAYRLPTEAEWEYAARAGTNTAFSAGDCIHTDQANYDGNYDYNNCGAKTGVYRKKTLVVDELAPNPWGLQHMHGNVYEWTQDCWHENYQAAPVDGSAWRDGQEGDCSRAVLRGGGWSGKTKNLRSAFRARKTTDGTYSTVGFRLARTL